MTSKSSNIIDKSTEFTTSSPNVVVLIPSPLTSPYNNVNIPFSPSRNTALITLSAL